MSMPMMPGMGGPPMAGPPAGLGALLGAKGPAGPPKPPAKKKTPAGAKNEALAAKLNKGGGKK